MTNARQLIGTIITITIDRPLGSKHPEFGSLYPLNYGYVTGTIAGDGEPLDAYVLGVFDPVLSFTGKCIACVHRANDNEEKLVVAPEGKEYTNEQITALLEFQERFFKSTIQR